MKNFITKEQLNKVKDWILKTVKPVLIYMSKILKYPLILLILFAAPIITAIIAYIGKPEYSQYNFTSTKKFYYEFDAPLKTKQLLPTPLAQENGITDTLLMIYASETSKKPDVIKQAILSAEKVGSTKDVKILVLYDKPMRQSKTATDSVETELLYITKADDTDASDTITTQNYTSTVIDTLGKANLGDPQTLYDFIFFGRSNFPSENSILVIDGIGIGAQGILLDETSNDYLTQAELTKAMSEISFSGDTILDLLIINSSFSGNIETVASLQKYVRYLIAIPGYTTTQPLNYGEIAVTLNDNLESNKLDLVTNLHSVLSPSIKTPTNRIISNQAEDIEEDSEAKPVICTANNYYLYNLINSPNVENGLETFATSYLNDRSLNTHTQYNNALANTSKLFESDQISPIFSLNSFVSLLAQNTEENSYQEKAVKQIQSDLENLIITPNNCDIVQSTTLSVSFIEKVDERLIKQFEEINYRSIIAFKEMIRQFPYKDEVDVKKTNLTEDTRSIYTQDLLPNHQYCYRGFEYNDQFFIANRELGIIEDKIFKCLKNYWTLNIDNQNIVPFEIDETFAKVRAIVQIDDEELLADLEFTFINEKAVLTSVNINGDGVSDFAYTYELPEKYTFEFLPFGKVANQDIDTGYYTPGKISISQDSQISKIKIEYRFGLSVVENRQDNETIKIFSEKDNKDQLFEIKFDYFALNNDENSLNNYITSENPTLVVSENTYDKDNIDFTRLETLTSIVNEIKGFKYYEYILANKEYQEALIDYHKRGYSTGTDIIYYSGSNEPVDENRKFWFEWFNLAMKENE